MTDIKTLEDLQKEKLQAEIDRIREETLQIRLSAVPKPAAADSKQNEKLQAEIDKINEETRLIRKPWYRQPSFLNLLVSFSVPILSLLAAYYLGGGKEYFDAKTLTLQNQKHDLEQDVKRFTEKKDSLNTRNIELDSMNGRLSLNQEKLLQDTKLLQTDTAELKKIARENSLKLSEFGKEKNTLQGQISSLGQQKDSLNEENKKKVDELSQSGFTEYYINLINSQDNFDLSVNTTIAKSLLNSIEKGGQFKAVYMAKVINTIDTTHNLQLKGVLQALLFMNTNELKWKTGLFATAEKVCDVVKQGEISRGNYYFWRIFGDIPWRSKQETLETIDFLTGCVKKIAGTDEAAGDILSNIAYLNGYNNEIPLYSNAPANFCYLLSVSKELINSKRSMVNFGALVFLDHHAPIAYVMLVSALFASPERYTAMSTYEKSELLGKITGLVEKNPEIFTNKPLDIGSPKSWEQWRNQYKELELFIEKLPNTGCQADELKKITGQRIV